MRTLYWLLLTWLILGNVAWAEEPKLGTLTGRFVYDGEPPKPVIGRFPDGREVLDESLLVDDPSRGIQNVTISMYFKPDGVRPAIPAAVSAKKRPAVQIHADNARLEPHVSMVGVGQTLEIHNRATVGMDLKADVLAGPLAIPIVPGKKAVTIFKDAEKLPVKIDSFTKSWIKGYLLVSDHPWVAVSDETGSFEIRDIPPGQWTFRVWQEKAGFVEAISRDGEPTKWPKGQVTLTIKPGTNNLGDILVSPAEFAGR